MDDLQKEFLEYLNSKNKFEKKLITEQIHSHYKLNSGLFVKTIRRIPFGIAFALQNVAGIAALLTESIISKAILSVIFAFFLCVATFIPFKGFLSFYDKQTLRLKDVTLGIGLSTLILIVLLRDSAQTLFYIVILVFSTLATIATIRVVHNQKPFTLLIPLILCFCFVIVLSETQVTGVLFSWFYLILAFSALAVASIISVKILSIPADV